MSPWDRRRVLKTLLGAAALPLAPSCGSRPTATSSRRVGKKVELGARLRDAADELTSAYSDASVLARTTSTAISERSAESRRMDRDRRHWLRLAATVDGQRRELWSRDLSPDGISIAVAELRRRLGPGRGRKPVTRALDTTAEGNPLLAAIDQRALDRVPDAIFEALTRLPSSRLIGRAARLESIERHDIFIDEKLERRQRFVHHRASASVVAWTGTVPGTATAMVGGSKLDGLTLDAKQLSAAESWALALLTAREVPRGTSEVLLTPAVSALLFGGCLVPCLDASDWSLGDRALADPGNRELGSPLLTIIDDPRGRHYGSRHFDDDGRVAEPITLVDGGLITGGLGRGKSHRSRRHRRAAEGWVGSPTRVRVAPGQSSAPELLRTLGDGIVLEGPIAAEVDRATLDFSLRVSRGLGVSKGTLSGRLYGSLAVRGNLLEVLRSARALSSHNALLPLGATDDFPHPYSVSAPALLTTALVEPG